MKVTFFATAAAVILLTMSPATAQECGEVVTFETAPGAFTMLHEEARFNCCAWLDVVVDQDGYEIDIREYEMFEIGPCFCLCCFETTASVSGLAAGEYTVTVRKMGTSGYEVLGPWVLEITGVSVPSVSTSYLPCDSTMIPDDDWSWGTIKALYR
jgi:hypothetical protein